MDGRQRVRYLGGGKEHRGIPAKKRCTNDKTMNVTDRLPMCKGRGYTSWLRAIPQVHHESSAR